MFKIESPSDMHSVYMKYNRLIKSIIYRMLGEAYVEDLLQDCLVKAWEKRKNFETEAEMKNWLCRLTINLCIDKIRKKNVRKGTSEVDDIEAYPADKKQNDGVAKLILKGLNELKEDFKSAFVLVALEGFTTKEASSILEVKESTVRTRVHRAREDLKVFLEKEGVSYE